MGTAVAAQDDADPHSHTWGNSGVTWQRTVPDLAWTNGVTTLIVSTPRANRGIFIQIDDASGIATIRHQMTGFQMGLERDFGLSAAFSSGIAYFGAPTAQTSSVRSGG